MWSPRVEKITKIKSKKDLHIPGAITSEAWGVAVGANLKEMAKYKFDGRKIIKIKSKNVLQVTYHRGNHVWNPRVAGEGNVKKTAKG